VLVANHEYTDEILMSAGSPLTTPFRRHRPGRRLEVLKTSADPTGTKVLGTQNNCSGGVTPWGTILSGEENFNQYFANADR
jgi:secreted PhoX family phosphatase